MTSTSRPRSHLVAASTVLGALLPAPVAWASGPGPELLGLLLIPAGLATASLILCILMLARAPSPSGEKAPLGVPIAALVVGALGLIAAFFVLNVAWMAIVIAVPSLGGLVLGAIRLSRSKPSSSR